MGEGIGLDARDEVAVHRGERHYLRCYHSACGKGQHWAAALSLLQTVQRECIEPIVITYNAAISACEKGHQWDRALGLLDYMRRVRIEAEFFSYTSAMREAQGAIAPHSSAHFA